nr:MAG TPA: hypothetical protein [Caudoviricetes sp.]
MDRDNNYKKIKKLTIKEFFTFHYSKNIYEKSSLKQKIGSN